jgi:hypothetical protein
MRFNNINGLVTVIWKYNDIVEFSKKSKQYVDALKNGGYKLMRSGREADQYAIDLSFKGEKNKTYQTLESQLKPYIREQNINSILGEFL